MTALRELLANFTVGYSGGPQLAAANAQVDALRAKMQAGAVQADRYGAATQKAVGKSVSNQGQTGALRAVVSMPLRQFGDKSSDASNSLRPVPGLPTPAQINATATAFGYLRERIQGLKDAPGIFDRLGGSFQKIVVASAGMYFAKEALGGYIDEAVGLGKAAKQIGTTVDEIDRLLDLGTMVEVSEGAMKTGIRGMVRNFASAGQGSKSAKDLFDALGVSTEAVGGKLPSVTQLLDQVVAGMQGIDDPTMRAGLAMQIFGRSGLELMPMLSRTPEELEKVKARIEELGGGLDPEFIKRAQELHEAQKELAISGQSFKTRVLASLLPALNRMARASTDAYMALQRLNRGGALSRMMVLGLAAVVATRVPAMIASVMAFASSWGLILIAMAAVILVAEDLWAAFSGGRSTFGEDFVPAVLSGLDTLTRRFRLFVADFSGQWSVMIAQAKEQFGPLLSVFGPLGDAMRLIPTGSAAEEQAKWDRSRQDAWNKPTGYSDDLQAVNAYNDRLRNGGRSSAEVAAASQMAIDSARAYQTGPALASVVSPGSKVEKNVTYTDQSSTVIEVKGTPAQQAAQVAQRLDKLRKLSRQSDEAALLADVQ